MVQFKNLALKDITFVLCARQVPLDEFNVLASREFEISPNVTGRVTIIGQSHVLHVSKGQDTLSEVMLCVPHDLSAYEPINQTTSLTNFRLGIVSGCLKYAARVSTRWATSPDAWSKLTQIRGQHTDSLNFHFPQGNMPLAPVTSVAWQIDRTMLTVRSIHTFPAENAVVKSKTRINWADLA
jgi:hypothetical protein